MASINKGDNTAAFGQNFLKIYLNNPNDLYITKAVFQINGNLEKEFDDPKFPLKINFTGAETELLAQVNVCKLALWDEYGRRRTADGRFTFFCKENRITSPDAPIYDGDEYYPEEDNTVYFDLDDAELACEFVINASPEKMSELQQDLNLMKPENIIGGINVRTQVDNNGNVIINAELDAKQSYRDLSDKPRINGIELVDDVEINLLDSVPQTDWNETNETSLAFIKNKPNFSTVCITGDFNDLINIPTIPTKLSQLTNDINAITKNVDNLVNYYTKAQIDENCLTVDTDRLVNYYTKLEIDDNLTTKFANYYDKTEIDNSFVNKDANNLINYYTKSEIDYAFITKLTNYYSKTELDRDFINKDTDDLTNYYTKSEIDYGFVNKDDDLQSIYNRILETEAKEEADVSNVVDLINNKIDSDLFNLQIANLRAKDDEIISTLNEGLQTINSTLENKANTEELDELFERVNSVITEEDLNDALALKANSSDIGTGKLTIKVNGESQGSFNANQKSNTNINISIPTNISDLTNDSDFVTMEDLVLDGFATKQELIDGLSPKANITDINDGITTIKKNGAVIGTIAANQASNKEINIVVPTNLSDLTQDISYLEEADLSTMSSKISELEDSSENAFQRLDQIENTLDTKVTISSTKSMVDNSEINRLRNVTNYDDTHITQQLNSLSSSVNGLNNAVYNKVDKIDGKGLSTNDFTDLDKDKIEFSLSTCSNNKEEILTLKTRTSDCEGNISGLITSTNNLTTRIIDETTARTSADINLQTQIEALQAKSTVIDILGTVGQLEEYDTTNLLVNDVICVLKDETKNNTVSYYRWSGSDFTYVGSEGVYYTRSESDVRYVEKTFEINGHSLDNNFSLTYQDVGALPYNTLIGNGTVVIQRNGFELEQFTLNQEENAVIDIKVPTKLSELSNDAYFITSNIVEQTYLGWPSEAYGDGGDTLLWDKAYYLEEKINVNAGRIDALEGNLPSVALSGDYNDLINKPTIPTLLSQLINDCGFITLSDIDLSPYITQADIPTHVSQLENDRGYVTTNYLGRGDVTVYLQDNVIGEFSVNTKDDVMITIPVDDTLSESSTNPIQNKIVKETFDLMRGQITQLQQQVIQLQAQIQSILASPGLYR